ncbi:trypsin-like peptidase domain-containing protein [Leucobacter weissii]|uniref:Trypsin-like peptidase domain-containing protein n=1 Tax=Leucobacter weissii TaxID=1983706 RepID=A0A939MLT2_9MICO|nr:trypsin-like peptidase domain-containing protein [Leucobacter weissii]MBO1901157.1 trypsin-like peptidase domain-containing protein [Leucobacter weissii]
MSTTPESERPVPQTPQEQPDATTQYPTPTAPTQPLPPEAVGTPAAHRLPDAPSAPVAPSPAPPHTSAPAPAPSGHADRYPGHSAGTGFPTQPTTPLPDAPHVSSQPAAPQAGAVAVAEPQSGATAAGGAVPPAFGGTATDTAPASEAPRSRQGGLIAGIAIGALLGGLVGGGAAAVVAHNASTPQTVQAQSGGTLTLNNTESATTISGVAAVATPSVVTLQVSSNSASGSGSGVIYSEDGYILTNAHVATLEGATSEPTIQVQFSDGTLQEGTLVGSDPFSDLAVIKVEAEGLTPITFADSDAINVGDLAVAIGAPLNLSNTVTSGIVSALNRGITVSSSMVPEQSDGQDDGQSQQEDPNEGSSPFPWFEFESPEGQQQQQQQTSSQMVIPVIQTDASINPGNSGGALLNAQGELIGVNVALASATATSEAAGSDGLGFAVPSNLTARVVAALIDGEKPSHGQLGVTQATTSSATTQTGGVIGEVTPGSPAEEAGLRSGDVITSVNGALADSFTTVTALIRMQAGGSEVTIGYNRDGEQYETTATLGTLEW